MASPCFRFAVAWLLLGGGVLAAVRPAAADDYGARPADLRAALPRDTRGSARTTPRFFAPDDARNELARRQNALRAWAARAERLAATYSGRRIAADLLHGAAYTFRSGSPIADPTRARRLGARALAAYRADDPGRIGLQLFLADEAQRIGHAPALRRAMEALLDWTPTVRAWSQDPALSMAADGNRRLAAVEAWHARYDLLAAKWNVMEGRPARAADAYLRAATSRLPRSRRRDRLLQKALSAYVAAGKPETAARVSLETVALLSGDGSRAERILWDLYAAHGMLDAQGKRSALHGDNGWRTTEAFQRDVRVTLDKLAGLRGSAASYLELGSRAHLAGDDTHALTIYLAALDNPDVARAVRQDPTIWEGLLVAYAAAMRLKRFDVAERILKTVMQLGTLSTTRADQLLAWLKSRRADHETTQRLTKEIQRARGASRGGMPVGRTGRRPAPRLEVAPPGSPQPGATVSAAVPSPTGPSTGWIWLVAVGLIALGLWSLWRAW